MQFYEGTDYLVQRVAEFLGEGFEAGDAAVVIATEPHRRALWLALRLKGHDADALARAGRLALLDASECLAGFMVDGKADPVKFREAISPLLPRFPKGVEKPKVRAFGEMVDLLWKAGSSEAVRLEELWNDLARTHDFSLLCAYELGGFLGPDRAQQFKQICGTHTHVSPAEGYTEEKDDAARLLQVTLLQQRALSLEQESVRRRELEWSLRASQRELSDFFENATEGIHAVGADGTILWANRAEFGLLGYSREEYVGRNIREFHADSDVIEDIFSRLSRNEVLKDHPARLRCKDGSIKHVLIHSNAAFRDGDLAHTRCFTRDVTERKHLEDALERQNEELHEALRFSETFVGMLGHDLRNPLSAITTAGRLLYRRAESDDVSRRSKRILNSADRMSRMIDQLLDFTRIRLGKGFRLEAARVDLAATWTAVVEELVGEETPALEVSITGDVVGSWDGDRLAQLFSNLLGNALTHRTPESPVTVRLDGTAGDQVALAFSNGGAIPAALLPTLFEPLKAEGKGQGSSGLGLGLYISQQIVRAHGGTLEVASSEDEGTCFTVRLPRGLPGAGHEGAAP